MRRVERELIGQIFQRIRVYAPKGPGVHGSCAKFLVLVNPPKLGTFAWLLSPATWRRQLFDLLVVQ